MTEPPVDPDLLNGWKEIASWSGRSVRSVQRWERDLGLPVHRIKTTDGQSVYARRSELDAWRASLDVQKPGSLDLEPESASVGEVADGLAAGAAGSRPTAGWPLRRIGLIAAVAVMAALIATIAMSYSGRFRTAEYVDFTDHSVRGFDASGEAVWDYDLGYPIVPAGAVLPSRPIRADLDGDGRVEMLVGVKHADRRAKPVQADALLCLDDEGRPCWTLRPEVRVTCGGEEFGAPWQIGDITIVEREGRRKVWVSFVHHTWAPSFVMEVDADGSSRLIYFQRGWISSVSEWRGPSGSYLVAGGVLNRFQRASVAFVRVEGFPSSEPVEEAGGGCEAMPGTGVERLIVLPSFDAQLREQPYPFVLEVTQLDSDLKVHYATGSGGPVVAVLDSSLNLRRLGRADAYWMDHRRLEEAGLIVHSAADCPERSAEKEVLVWRPEERWLPIQVNPTGP